MGVSEPSQKYYWISNRKLKKRYKRIKYLVPLTWLLIKVTFSSLLHMHVRWRKSVESNKNVSPSPSLIPHLSGHKLSLTNEKATLWHAIFLLIKKLAVLCYITKMSTCINLKKAPKSTVNLQHTNDLHLTADSHYVEVLDLVKHRNNVGRHLHL